MRADELAGRIEAIATEARLSAFLSPQTEAEAADLQAAAEALRDARSGLERAWLIYVEGGSHAAFQDAMRTPLAALGLDYDTALGAQEEKHGDS